MRKDPKRTSKKDISRRSNRTPRQSGQSTQHGKHSSPLLLLPSESLTHITSFLDPVSLCSLAQTSQKFYEHVSDDNTWRRAFVCQYLGVSPENALSDARALTFRSTQKTWRLESVRRHVIRRLWSRSKSALISHHPVAMPISLIHVMADYGLLSASTNRCVVARSFPFRDKVLKDYLYGTGIPPGLGNGLPNINFMPDITACAIASDGTTAKVIWGRQDGSVIIVSHPRTMSGTQAPARIHTSSVVQGHGGAVLDGTWAANGDAFVTVGSDGRVKVWSLTPFRCIWTSDTHLSGRDVDAILRVAEDLANGLIVAASESGDLIIMSGFYPESLSAAHAPLQDIGSFCVSIRTFLTPDPESASVPQPMKILALYFQASSPTKLSILACYLNASQFYRCSVDLRSEQVDVDTFGNAGFGTIRCIQPAFSNDPAESSFILVGTQLGIVSIYDWDTTSLSSDPFLARRHVDVFSDAHVTSLTLNPFVIAAGSSRGTVVVLDLLTFETLRSFPVPVNNAVQQIELVGDVLVANVSSQVLAWSAGRFVSDGKNSVRIKGKGKQGGHGKWFRQVELRSDIVETSYLPEKYSLKRSLGPEREQLMQLQTLGLNEREAVEYTLMLSRDEELRRLQGHTSEHVGEGEIFVTDEGLRGQFVSDQPSLSSASVRQSSSPPLSPSTSWSSARSQGHLVPLASPTSSNIKVQVSPRFNPEPKEAGGLHGSPPDSQQPMPPKGSPSSLPFYSQSTLGPGYPQATLRSQVNARMVTSSGKPGAWNKPLPGMGLTASPALHITQCCPSPPRKNWEADVERIRQEDLELRLALELSLAEAEERNNTGGT